MSATKTTLQNVFIFGDGTWSLCADRCKGGGHAFHRHSTTMQLWDCAINNTPRTAVGVFALLLQDGHQFAVIDGVSFPVRSAFEAVLLYRQLTQDDQPPRARAARRAA